MLRIHGLEVLGGFEVQTEYRPQDTGNVSFLGYASKVNLQKPLVFGLLSSLPGKFVPVATKLRKGGYWITLYQSVSPSVHSP